MAQQSLLVCYWQQRTTFAAASISPHSSAIKAIPHDLLDLRVTFQALISLLSPVAWAAIFASGFLLPAPKDRTL
jgi:hypothetical protein